MTESLTFLAAWVGTDPAVLFFGLKETHQDLVSVPLVLPGDQIMHAVIVMPRDPQVMRNIISKRLGGGKLATSGQQLKQR